MRIKSCRSPESFSAPGRNGRRVDRVVALSLVLVIVAAAVTWLDDQGFGPRPSANPAASQSGPSGVAAAYGYPLGCLSVTILATDRTYARADFNHLSGCGRYTWYPTAIFQYVSGRWQPILDAVEYQCPVASLPRVVQVQLAVCQ
jgi:hypothetical protein